MTNQVFLKDRYGVGITLKTVKATKLIFVSKNCRYRALLILFLDVLHAITHFNMHVGSIKGVILCQHKECRIHIEKFLNYLFIIMIRLSAVELILKGIHDLLLRSGAMRFFKWKVSVQVKTFNSIWAHCGKSKNSDSKRFIHLLYFFSFASF